MRRLHLVLFLSGLAALLDQLCWARLFARLLGSDALSQALVLGVFMAGLGLGAQLLGPRLAQFARAERCLAACAAGVGSWAMLSPFALEALAPLEQQTTRALWCVLVLLPPTLLMGASFPLLGRLGVDTLAHSGAQTARLYAANTLGAASGALVGAFCLLPWLGLRSTLLVAGGLDLLAALLALGLASQPAAARAAAPAGARALPASARRLLYSSALLGAAALALEVLLTRLLICLTGASTYAFALVLAAFLMGLAWGSVWIQGRLARTRDSAQWPVWCALGALCATGLGLCCLEWRLGQPDLFGPLRNSLPADGPAWTPWLYQLSLAGFALCLPALAFGAALPAALGAGAAALERARGPAARQELEPWMARLYLWNTLGAMLGSLLAVFVLLPVLGLRGGVLLSCMLMLLAAWVALPARPRESRRHSAGPGRLALLSVLCFAPCALALWPEPLDAGEQLLVWRNDRDQSALVTEVESAEGPVRTLRVNGTTEASSAAVDQRLQRVLGHLPALVHGHVQRALVIGLGSGMTAGALLDFDSLRELDIFELSAGMPDCARAFAAWNNAVVDDPRTRLSIGDGRHALATAHERWDLITADPIHPFTRGSSALYTLEHFEAMREHLAPGGVASQWLPLYQISELDARTVSSTWCASFESVSAWLTAYDLVLLGSQAAPTRQARLALDPLPPRVLAALAPLGLQGGAELAALQVADDRALRAYAAGVAPMQDDRPVLEFRAPFALRAGYTRATLQWAARPDFLEQLPARARERAQATRAALLEFLEHGGVGAYGDALLALPPAAAR